MFLLATKLILNISFAEKDPGVAPIKADHIGLVIFLCFRIKLGNPF